MKLIAPFAAVAALLPAAVAAQGSGLDPAATWKLLQKYDQDGDGEVTATEYGRGDDKFARFDRDGDGVLTAADFATGGGRARGNRGGGRRAGGQRAAGARAGNRAAMIAGPELAKAADADRSGSVSAAEWQAFVAGLEPADDGRIDAKNLPFGSGAMGGRVTGMLRSVDDLAEIFAALDADQNGALERAEMGALPVPGDVATDFELPFAGDAEKTLKLSSLEGERPVALIFGSYT